MDLEEISKQYGIAIEELKTVESVLKQKYSSVQGIMPAEQIEKYIESGVKQHLDKFKNMGLSQYFGVILRLSSPQDGVAKRRATAIKKYVENPEEAIAYGYVQEFKNSMKRALIKGIVTTKPVIEVPKTAVYLPDQKVYIIPTDERETWKSGKKNFNYLKPIPLEQYFVNVEGICSLDGTIWSPFKMIFNCAEHINITIVTVPQSKLVKFYAKVKTKEPLELGYNNKYTKFDLVDGDISQLNAEIMNFYDVIQLSEIDTVFRGLKTKYDVVSVFGQIRNKWQKEPSDDNPTPWITASIVDNTRDEPLKLLIHPDMSAEFEEQSIVKVWGALSEGKKWDPEFKKLTDEPEITMFANGVYVFSVGEEIPQDTTHDDGWES